ncbi:carbohydrate-binding domain-containing protein [Streptococcus acidominimus]|uniref:carbohydrate-binding domain-containing protein n=1 Tax=Streptococcus acidominimus TaxID=1326 RepID=UPI00142FEFB1|nr:carbohydrate-binding domain-containing protein [Streptococcus acidominimus]MBF0818826.1 carbohydrate-binding domain-containing protein [Streptococcus acidominimus]MBF0839177.1 carbohydrate-binding domain-containing protein [Streptococcus acidominimus]MBF0849182.1 carbohydrate-binding domain-containing protein [Streptococcus danieliae]
MNVKQIFVSSVTLLSIGSLVACSRVTGQSSASTQTSQTVTTVAATIDWASLPTKEVTLSNEGLTITEAGSYVLTGTTTAGVKVNTSGNVRLVLAGVTISSQDTVAIYVEAADNVLLELKEGTENTVSDSKQHTDSNIEGAIHSKADLTITGTGGLMVEGNFEDGIVSSDDLMIEAGMIQVTAADDGIRGKDSVTITGGIVTVEAGDDGIKAESSLIIDDGQVTVAKSTEGVEGANVTINGGTVDVTATDDGVNAASDVMGADIFIKVTGGKVKVSVGQGDTDAFDSNGDLFISGGSIEITAPTSAFDVDGTVSFTGGDVTVNGQKQTDIVATGPGGGFGGEPGAGNRS